VDVARARSLYERACDRLRGAGACTALGTLYERGHGVPADRERARRLYLRGCEGGYHRGCYLAGQLAASDTGAARSLPRALALLERACAGGFQVGCSRLANLYAQEDVGPERKRRVDSLFARGCAAGEGFGCYYTSLRFQNGWNGTTPSADSARAYLDRSCAVGNLRWGPACTLVGRRVARDTTIDPARRRRAADSLYALACAEEDGDGCFYHGDMARALALYERSCERTGTKCFDAGDILERGLGTVPQDLPRAVEYYRRACGRDDPGSCSRAGSRLAAGEGVPRDTLEARRLIEKGCADGSAMGCYNLGMLHEYGAFGLARDAAKARELYVKACNDGQGQPKACERVTGRGAP
jgi:TPR repeat protein